MTTHNYNAHYVILQCDNGKYTLELRRGLWGMDKIRHEGRLIDDLEEAERERDYLNAWQKAGKPKDSNITLDKSPDEGADCKWRVVEE